MTNIMHIKGEQCLMYNTKVWHKNDAFDILNNINEYINLAQLLESVGNVNHAISILGYWISDSNYEKITFSDTIIIGYNMLSFHW